MAWHRGPGDSPLFRDLTDDEEMAFREYAREHDPEDITKWRLYHPVCIQVWRERGFKFPGDPLSKRPHDETGWHPDDEGHG